MSLDPTSAAAEPLQLDVAVPATDAPGQPGPRPSVTCAFCRTTLDDEYHHVGGKPACAACRRIAESHAAVPTGPGTMARAALYALGAAIAGAIVYYAVIALTELEIGIVAILIGYMVGWAVRRATKGRGGRRFQILAAVFTYWSVGLAYSPLAFKSFGEGAKKNGVAVAADSAAKAAAGRAPEPRATKSDAPMDVRTLGIGIAVLFGFSFALPVMAVFGSLPSGLLSGVIIYIGLRQAWRMTAAPVIPTSGPYRVGTAGGAT